MRNNKRFIQVISITAFLISVLVVFCTGNKKHDEKAAAPTSVSEKSVIDTFQVRPLSNIQYERTDARLKRGEYLTGGLLQCFTCHSPRNWDAPGAPPVAEKKGAGGTILFEDSTSLIIAPNITPDKETGAGTWTDDMLARAIREGVGHDGRALFWQMPSTTFRNLSDEDLASVIVYLRSIPPVHNVVRPAKMSAAERSGTERSLRPLTEPVEMPDLSDPMKKGKYLVRLGECAGCHTSHSDYNPGLFGGGNYIDRFGRKVFSANITSDPSGMAYGPEGFIFVIRTGKGGTLSPTMPWISFKNMNDDDLKAIYAYLGTFPHAKHAISNQAPFTHCAICDQEHGLGDKNKREKPTGIKQDPALYDLYAGTYFNEKYNWSVTVMKEKNNLIFQPWENGPKIELVPQSELHFLAPGWVLPMSFSKDKDGHITQLMEDSDEGLVYKKIK
jgi:mono/diheme cytochrome c family protein